MTVSTNAYWHGPGASPLSPHLTAQPHLVLHFFEHAGEIALRGCGQTGASPRQIDTKPGHMEKPSLSHAHRKEDIHQEPRETFHKTCYTEEPRRNLSLPKVIRQLLSLHSRPACLSDLRSSKTNPLSGTAKGSRTLKSPQHKGTLQKGGGEESCFYNAYGDTNFRSFSQTAPQRKMLRYTYIGNLMKQ